MLLALILASGGKATVTPKAYQQINPLIISDLKQLGYGLIQRKVGEDFELKAVKFRAKEDN